MKILLYKYLMVLLAIGGTALFFVFSPVYGENEAQAGCEGLIITEIMPDDSDGSEWIEVFNSSEKIIELSGCQIADSYDWQSHRTNLVGELEPKAYKKIDTASGIFNNSGEETARILQNGIAVFSITYDINPPEKGKSYAYNLTKNSWKWPSKATPGEENQFIEELPEEKNGVACEGIIISELMPDPISPLTDENDEWIELYNPTTAQKDLSGCILSDIKGTVHQFHIPKGTILGPKSYAVFYSREMPITLNNDADGIILSGPEEQILAESIPYTDGREGFSFIFESNTWKWTSQPTPGAPNVFAGISTTSTTVTLKTSKSNPTKKVTTTKKTLPSAQVKGVTTTLEQVTTFSKQSDAAKVSNRLLGYGLVVLAVLFGLGFVSWENRLKIRGWLKRK